MPLDNVVKGQAHIAAHNEERAAIRKLLTHSPVLLLAPGAPVPEGTEVGTIILRKAV